MAQWLKLSGTMILASMLSACIAGGVEDFEGEEEHDVTDDQSLIGQARIMVNELSGRCMSVTDGLTTEGATVASRTCSALDSQRWTVRERGIGTYEIIAAHSGHCLAIEGGSKLTGARAIQAKCSGAASQLFQLNTSMSKTRLRNANSSWCLDLAGRSTAEGASIVQTQCDGTRAQQWTQR